MPEPAPQIYALLSNAMGELEPIAKTRKNTAQNYSFRGIDDIYAALNKVLVGNQIFYAPRVLDVTREERETKSGALMVYTVVKVEYVFYAPDGSFVTTVSVGEGADTGDKSVNKAMTSALKSMLIQLFCIPTEGDSIDSERDHYEAKKADRPRTMVEAIAGETKRKPACPECGVLALTASSVASGTYWCNKNDGGCGAKGIVLASA